MAVLTDYVLTKLESQIERSKTNAILFDKADVQALLNEVRSRRLKDRMASVRNLNRGHPQ